MAIKVEHSVLAKCRPEHVWQKFQKAEEWPWWNRVIGQAKWLEGQPWQKGSRLWLDLAYPKRLSLKSAIAESKPPEAVGWSGDGTSMRFRFEPRPDGTTSLRADAEMSGVKAVLGGGSWQKAMQTVLSEWLDALKAEAEKIAREEFARS